VPSQPCRRPFLQALVVCHFHACSQPGTSSHSNVLSQQTNTKKNLITPMSAGCKGAWSAWLVTAVFSCSLPTWLPDGQEPVPIERQCDENSEEICDILWVDGDADTVLCPGKQMGKMTTPGGSDINNGAQERKFRE
jgi:hypothetical protein